MVESILQQLNASVARIPYKMSGERDRSCRYWEFDPLARAAIGLAPIAVSSNRFIARYVSLDMTAARNFRPLAVTACSILLAFATPHGTWAQNRPPPRIYVSASETWAVEMEKGGSRPQTVEIIKTFQKRCDCVVTMKEETADYVVMVDREGGKDLLRRDNKFAVYYREEGDILGSGSTRTIGNAVKDACGILWTDWNTR